MRKISQAAASVGIEGEVLPGSRIQEVVFAHTRDEVERLQEQDPRLFETAGETMALSGEEYRQELRKALRDPDYGPHVKTISWGAGSGFARGGARPGFVFCARVGDYPLAQFRYVEATNPSMTVISDTLACLAHASCTSDTSRVLDEETHRQAYEAWSMGRRSIFDVWQRATDPRNLQPTIPRTLRDAADLLRAYPPDGLEGAELIRLINAVEGPYPERIQKVIRNAMRSTDDQPAAAVAVAGAIDELGLQPSRAPEPLPVITEDDIHLICWLAIAPAAPSVSTIAEQTGQFNLGDTL